jgi:glycosyltransferase involved in cell wall biosynthesis
MTQTIAILHYAGPPGIGGVEVTMAAHARVLAADGYAVRLISGHSQLGWPGVAVLNHPDLGSRGERVALLNRELAQGIVSPAFEALVGELAGWLAGALEGAGCAIVHNVLTLHKNLAFTAALHRLHQEGRAPRLLAWCHDFAWRDPLYQPELHAGFPWDLLQTAWKDVRYVAVSQDRRTLLADMLGVPPSQIAVVTPGIDLAALLKLEPATAELVGRLGLVDAEPLLLLPARITRRKNIELAIAIVGALRAEMPGARLVVTGPPGPHNPANAAYLAQLQELRAVSGAGDAIIFLYEQFTDEHARPRPVADAMLADLYRLADGLLFPSAYEGFGIPVLEAGLAGLPIFCSDIAPFRETAGAAALYFGLREPPEAIAARIAAALRADMRVELRQRVRRAYTWEAIYRHAVVPLLRED